MENTADSQDSENEILSRELVLSALVHEVTRVLHSAATLDQALNSFLLGIMEMTDIQDMALFAIREGQSDLQLTHSLGLEQVLAKAWNFIPNQGCVQECLTQLRHVLVDKPNPSDPFRAHSSRNYLVMPITARLADETEPGLSGQHSVSRVRALGLLWLDTGSGESAITGQTISHLTGLTQQAGLMMETFRIQRELAATNSELKNSNAKLKEAYVALSKAQKHIEDDLDRARAIQNSLLPASFPTQLLRRIASKYIPAGKVGGDYYDCFDLGGCRLGMVVADVSGHGIGAALVMSMFKVLLRTFSMDSPSPCAVLNRINHTFVQQQLGRAQFVTAFYAIFDKASRRLTYCNAGHVAQLLRLDPGSQGGPDSVLEMPSQGLVLGMFGDTFLSDATLELTPEARLFLFTDGITEAHGTNGKMFGVEPMLQLAMASGTNHPVELIDDLMATRSAFLGGSMQAKGDLADDATLVIVDL